MRKLAAAIAVIALVVIAIVLRPTPPPAPAAPPPPVVDAYGIDPSELAVERRTVRPRDTLSDLLSDFNVGAETVSQLASISRPVFDVRRIRPGKEFVVYHADDSLKTARIAVYEEDAVSYVVFDLRDSVTVRTGTRPVTTVVRTVRGDVDGSLYQSLLDQDVDGTLAIRLSEVYAWQIDFYRLQAGDEFKVSFEERYVDDQRIGVGRVLAAHFVHGGRNFQAYYYEDGDIAEYYDEEGNSLRKAFLAAPVEYSRISSRYTLRRFHPVQKRYKAHLGTDYAAPYGTPIRSTGDGVVLEAAYTSGNGRYVKIRHNGTYTTGYLHMSRHAQGMRPGVAVKQGDVIGYVGSTGLATGNHVCYRFWKNGQQVDPLREEFPSVEPIPDDMRGRYEAVRDQWLAHLTETENRIGPTLALVLR